jgi:CBS domain-containing protein
LLKQRVTAVDPDLPVANLVDEYLMSGAERAFPVIEEGDRLLGIVTMEDVRKVPRDEWAATRVRDMMTPAPALVTAASHESAAAALAKLAQRDVEQLPVVDDSGRLLGMVRRRDILRWLELQPRPGAARPRERHA